MFKHKRILSVVLFVLSWGYIVFKFSTYDEYALLFRNLSSLPTINYLFLFIVLLLMPLNLWLEVYKWHTSVNLISNQTFSQSFSQVILGNAGAFITPYRIGEYPSRAYYLDNKDLFLSAIVLGFIGTLALEIINVGVGLPASLFYFIDSDMFVIVSTYILIFILFVVFFIFLPDFSNILWRRKFKHQQSVQVIEMLKNLTTSFLFKLILLSLLRYLVYTIQLYLILKFFAVDISILQALVAIPTYYMLVSITPSLPIADAAIRGSWGILVFQAYTYSVPSIAFATLFLWLINIVLPLIAVPFVKK